MDLDVMRDQFNKALEHLISTKRDDNKAFLSYTEYKSRIEEVKQAKDLLSTRGAHKTVKDYRRVRKYDVMMIGGKERLIKPVVGEKSKQVLYYAMNDELFDIIHKVHSEIGHGGRNRMAMELKKNYCNVTTETIMLYLGLCSHCQKRSSSYRKTDTAMPILYSKFNSYNRLEVIDMEEMIYENFRFLFIYQELKSKFILLRALKSRNEIATHLLDIFTTFGPPACLSSDEGEEFIVSVLTELKALWSGSGIKTVYTQLNSYRDFKENIKKMVVDWMEKNQTNDWTSAIKFVQFEKNQTQNFVVGKSPYEEVFGCTVGVFRNDVNLSSLGKDDTRLSEDQEIYLKNCDNIMIKEEQDGENVKTEIQDEKDSTDNCEDMLFKMEMVTDEFSSEEEFQLNVGGHKRSGEYLEEQTCKIIKLSK